MIVLFSALTWFLHAAHGRRVHSSSEGLQRNRLQDSQKPGKLSSLNSLENLLLDLKPTTAFNPSGPLTSSRSLRPTRSNKASMLIAGSWQLSRQAGSVLFFDLAKGYGFIKMDNGENMYVNSASLDVSQKVRGIANLVKGERVEFSVDRMYDGKLQAVGVTGPKGSDLKGGDFAQEGVGPSLPFRRQYDQKVKDYARGTVRKWNSDKAFGFITADTGEDCFVHKDFIDDYQQDRGVESLAVGEKVQFDIRADADGNMAAIDVTGVGDEDLTNDGPGQTAIVGMQRIRGTVIYFNIKKRWGHIQPESGDAVFVHHFGINPEQRAKGIHHLIEGEQVEFRIEQQANGHIRAFDVTGPLGTDLKALEEGPGTVSYISARGKVTDFDKKTGWGHIMQDNGQELFVHASGIDADQRETGIMTLMEGESVQFNILANKVQAVDVTGPDGSNLKGTREGKLPQYDKTEPVLKQGVAGTVLSYDDNLETGRIVSWTLNDGAQVPIVPDSIDVSQQANGIYHLNRGEEVEFNILGTSVGTLKAVDVIGPKGAPLQGTVEEILSDEEFIGIVEYYRPEAQWGFIAKMDGGKIYVHHTGIVPDPETLKAPILVEGEKVRFKKLTSRDGDKAVDVTLATEVVQQESDFLADPQERIKGSVLQFNPRTKTGFLRSHKSTQFAGEPILIHVEDIIGNADTGYAVRLDRADPLEFRVERIDGQARALDITGPDGDHVVSKHTFKGKLRSFSYRHNYGFIELEDGQQIFVHASELGGEPIVGVKVECHIQIGEGGKKRAVYVNELELPQPKESQPKEVKTQVSQDRDVGSDRVAGNVRWFNQLTGWGVIEDDNGDEIFVHSSAITADQKAKGVSELAEGERVEFNVVAISDDKKKATDVTGPGGADLEGAQNMEEQDEEEQDETREPELAVR